MVYNSKSRLKLITITLSVIALSVASLFLVDVYKKWHSKQETIIETPHVYTLTYVIFYPNHIDTLVIDSDRGFVWGSHMGTNYIIENKNNVFSDNKLVYRNTAPFKILSYNKK